LAAAAAFRGIFRIFRLRVSRAALRRARLVSHGRFQNAATPERRPEAMAFI
jgi:hypothetical protein